MPMEAHVRLPHVIGAAQQLADDLENPCRLVTLHRDIDQLHDGEGNRLGKSKKQHALRWAVFTMAFGAIKAFFNEIWRSNDDTRVIPLNPSRFRDAVAKQDVRLSQTNRLCEPEHFFTIDPDDALAGSSTQERNSSTRTLLT